MTRRQLDLTMRTVSRRRRALRRGTMYHLGAHLMPKEEKVYRQGLIEGLGEAQHWMLFALRLDRRYPLHDRD